MKQLSVLQKIKSALSNADSIGKNKDGNIVVRRGFYYRHGLDCDKFADLVMLELKKAGLNYPVIDRGEKWASFRGGASIAQQSHWWVVISPIERSE